MTEFLGVTTDENLNWPDVKSKFYFKRYIQGVGVINKLKYLVLEGVLYLLYCTFI